ncbi:MAG: chromosomal replication initiator protein DnaA [Acidimicrobiaceae bacterium]|nr:chromosomal replication initiator protein DnaA [Acidimicrobiaceae bacterium]
MWTALWISTAETEEERFTLTDAAELWGSCAERLRILVGQATWLTWFDQVKPVDLDDRLLWLRAPNSLVRDRLEDRYLGTIQELASEIANRSLVINLSVEPSLESRGPDLIRAGVGADPTPPGGYSVAEAGLAFSADSTALEDTPRGIAADDQTGSDLPTAITSSDHHHRHDPLHLNPRYTFEAFVIGASNRFAHAAAQRVAETPASSYNPLFIHGDSGLGKTHLLHAIGHYVAVNFPSLTIRYVSTETFLNDFVDAIRTNGQPAFKRRYRECDVLLVDDIQFIERKEALQEEFFHTFNALYENAKQIVLSSDRHPRSIATLEDRLRSRFEWGLITDIQPPELETRLAILRKKADGARTLIPSDVLELIATHVRDNIRELEGALIRVSAFASLNKEPLTLEVAETVLSDILDVHRPQQITARLILQTTAEMFGFTIDELCGTNRRRPLVNARQIGMYVFRELTDYSYPAIGREFGNRDHTTVIHAVDKISGLISERRQVYEQVTELILRIKGGN